MRTNEKFSIPHSILEAERLTLTQVARKLNKAVSSIWRWAQRGVRGHRLRTVVIGGRRYVLLADLEEFLTALNTDASSSPVRSPSAEQRADDAERRLDELGI